jgi:hypothetical protein
MTTITAILEPDADGTVHVPVPAGMPQGMMKVTATFEPSLNPADERAVRARRLLGAGRRFSPQRDSGAELAAERATEG